jgi:DNA-binding transcriptional ArsR family regulator
MIALGNVSALARPARACPSSSAEICLALWAGRAPEPEPLCDASHRLVQRMPEQTRNRIVLLDRALPDWPLRAMKLLYDSALEVGAALDVLQQRSSYELELALLSGGTIAVSTGIAAAQGARRHLSHEFALTVLEVIDQFWRRCFADVWEMQEPALGDVVQQIGLHLATNLASALERLTPRARALREKDALFLVSSQQAGTIDCASIQRLEVLPTLWLRRGAVAVEGEEKIGLCIHARVRRTLEAPNSARLIQVMNALADPQRFEIVRLCSSRARSTQDLSRLLGITPAPVSRHLRQLKEVQIVVGRRAGRYVLYELIPETLTLAAVQLEEVSRDGVCEAENIADLEADLTGRRPIGAISIG